MPDLCEGRPAGTRPLDALPPDAKEHFVVRVAKALMPSPFARRTRWSSCVVVLRPEGDRITSRGDFIGYLLAADLRGAANECRVRQVPPGHVLVWLEADYETVAIAGFLIFDLRRAAAEL